MSGTVEKDDIERYLVIRDRILELGEKTGAAMRCRILSRAPAGAAWFRTADAVMKHMQETGELVLIKNGEISGGDVFLIKRLQAEDLEKKEE